jgi:hypothetical protein
MFCLPQIRAYSIASIFGGDGRVASPRQPERTGSALVPARPREKVEMLPEKRLKRVNRLKFRFLCRPAQHFNLFLPKHHFNHFKTLGFRLLFEESYPFQSFLTVIMPTSAEPVRSRRLGETTLPVIGLGRIPIVRGGGDVSFRGVGTTDQVQGLGLGRHDLRTDLDLFPGEGKTRRISLWRDRRGRLVDLRPAASLECWRTSASSP